MNINKRSSNRRLQGFVIGTVMLAFGVSQISRPGQWTEYVPRMMDNALPISKTTIIRGHSIGNLLLGALLALLPHSRFIWFINAQWWGAVSFLCGRVHWRAGARDAAIFIATLVAIRSFDRR